MSLVDRLRAVIRESGDAPLRRVPPGVERQDGSDEGRDHAPGRRHVPGNEAADTLGGYWQAVDGQRFLVVDRRYRPGHRHGRVCVADVLPATNGVWPRFDVLGGRAEPQDPTSRALFFDLETTGLAGGAGTYAFLVGCGWFEEGSFRTRQFFLADFGAEAALLNAVAGIATEAATVVTFNGKSFDLPLMDTRFILHRRQTPFAGLSHVDMLHAARQLWRSDEDGCRLTVLEQSLFGYLREGDVAGFEIPARYFHYVRTGDARSLTAVLEHNRLDLLSLACVTARAAQLLDEGPASARGAREALGLGRLYERSGLLRDAHASFERACVFDADTATLAEALRACAVSARRLRCHDEAAAAWRRLLELPGCRQALVREAAEALAVHHEHRVGNLDTARTLTLKSLTCHATLARREALEHRLARIESKIARPELFDAVGLLGT